MCCSRVEQLRGNAEPNEVMPGRFVQCECLDDKGVKMILESCLESDTNSEKEAR